MFEHITKVLTGLKLIKFINSLIDLINSHLSNYNNPHKVTAEQLGLSNAYKYKGSVPTYQDLPSTAESGDVYNVVKGDKEIGVADGANFAWNGSEWDNLGGLCDNYDLSGYAQLNSANTFTALNTFRANIAVSNGTAAGSQGQIVLGVKPQSATVQANIISSTTGALNYIATENTGHTFRIGNNVAATSITTNEDETAILSHNAFEFARITNVGVARWLGNATTATKLETARTINGVAFDGTKDITINNVANATTATKLETARTINGVAFDGTKNITINNVANATTATKLGSSTVGSGVQAIYLNAGTATASNSTVGNSNTPVYLNAGIITACDASIGSGWTVSKGAAGWARENTTGFTIQWWVGNTDAIYRSITYPRSFSTLYYANVIASSNCETFVTGVSNTSISFCLCNGYSDDRWSGSQLCRLYACGLT